MPEATAPVIKDGVYLTGRFAGRTVQEVAEYASTLESELDGRAKPPVAAPTTQTPPQPPATPETRLNEQGGGRVASVLGEVTNRIEAEDEEAFASSVSDYADFKDRIKGLKGQMGPEARLQKGLTETIYWNLKMQDPEVRARMRKSMGVVTPLEEHKEEEVPPAPDPPAPTPTPQAPLSRTSRAIPAPSVPPTSPTRTVVASKTPQLVAPDKMVKAAKAWGIPVEEYLTQLQERGMSQEDIDRESASRETRRKSKDYNRSIYDRT